MKRFNLPHRTGNFLNTWSEFNQLSAKYSSVHLHQGSPQFTPPKFVRDNLTRATNEGHNQYTASTGHPLLRQAISEYYSPILNQNLKNENIQVTIGAGQAIGLSALAFVNPGQQVLTIQPYFPQYYGQTQLSGGIFKTVNLKVETAHDRTEWKLDIDAFRNSISSKTKVLIFNNPHNPSGKCFTQDELEQISAVLDQFPNLIVVADEVYDFLTYDTMKHIPFATVGNNRERTISVYSFGKLYNCTGWKLGSAIGPQNLVKEIAILNDSINFEFNSVCQAAIAFSFKQVQNAYEGSSSYPNYSKDQMEKSRNRLIEIVQDSWLSEMGIKLLKPQSGYFMLADISSFESAIPKKYFTNDYEEDPSSTVESTFFKSGKVPLDYAVARWLTMEKGMTPLPGSMFYSPISEDTNYNFIRFAFCRLPETFVDLEEKLSKK